MKKYVFMLIGLPVIILSCNSDDAVPATSSNYQPLGTGNYWNYDVQGTEMSERDSLFVSQDTVISTKSYKNMRTGNLPSGFFSLSLNNNSVRSEGGKVYMTGNAGLSLGNFLPLDLELSEFIILDENATLNQQLSTMNGSANQDVEGIPLNLTYVLTTQSGAFYPTYTTPAGLSYANVKSVQLKLNLKVSTVYQLGSLPLTVPILNAQDVVVSERFYAPNIGMIYSTTNFSYQLQDLSQFGFELPIPQSGQETQTETLSTYNVD